MATRERYSGWAVLAGCVILMVFPGGLISYTSSLFMYPICSEFGISTTGFSFTFTIGAGISAVTSAFLVQYLAKGSRVVMKALMGVGAVFTCGGFACMSLCSDLWQFYAVTAVWNLGLNLVTNVPVGMLVTNWFVQKRAMMTGIAFAGGNVGGAIFNGVISQIISTQGWQAGYVFGGILSLVASLAAVLFLIKRSPEEYGQKAYGAEATSEEGEGGSSAWAGLTKKEAMKTGAFYMLCLATLLTGIMAGGVANHVVNYLCTGGWEIASAGLVMTAYPIFGILGNSGGGALLSKIGVEKGVVIGAILIALAMLALMAAQQAVPMAYAFALCFGCAAFFMVVMPSLAVTETFGSRDYSGIFGVTYAFYLIGCAVSAPIIAVISEAVGYQVAWVAVIAIAAAVTVLYLACFRAARAFKERDSAAVS